MSTETPQRIPLDRHNINAVCAEFAKRPDGDRYRLHVETDKHGNTVACLYRCHLRAVS